MDSLGNDSKKCDLSAFTLSDLSDEKALSLENTYILKMCGKSNKIGIASSDSSCEVYSHNGSSLKKICKFPTEKSTLSDVRFSPLNESLLYSCSADGSIKLWDLRAGDKCSAVYQENPETKLFTKPLLSFDVSCNDRVLCGGSESIQGDAFMLFWDVRSTQLLGAYWNSHIDDITQVQFDKNKCDQLVTASVDGLINVFDITELSEDDALQYSLNAECAVDKISIISDNTIACITDNVDVQLWNFETADQICKFSREDISNAIKGQNVDDCYVISVYKSVSDSPVILAGSYSDKGNCLRTLQINKNKLKPLSDYVGNKQIVRCSWFDYENDLLFTGGESGFLSLWKNEPSQQNDRALSSGKNKILGGMNKMKIHKEKPY